MAQLLLAVVTLARYLVNEAQEVNLQLLYVGHQKILIPAAEAGVICQTLEQLVEGVEEVPAEEVLLRIRDLIVKPKI